MIPEKILLDYLNGSLDVPGYVQIQAEMPERYVVIERTGSSKENYIYSASFAIQSYAESMYEAAALNEQVKDAMERMLELDTVSKVQLNSDYNWTDTTTKKYRYQAIYRIVFF